MSDPTIFRIHGSAMEPCFCDGEFLEVDFARRGHNMEGAGAEIVVRYQSGKHELVEYFGNPTVGADGESATSVADFGFVVRRLRIVPSHANVLRIDAKADTRWRERRSVTRTLFPVHGLPRDVGPLSPREVERRSAKQDVRLRLFLDRMDAAVHVMPRKDDDPDDTLMTSPPLLPKRRHATVAGPSFVGPKRPRGRPRKVSERR